MGRTKTLSNLEFNEGLRVEIDSSLNKITKEKIKELKENIFECEKKVAAAELKEKELVITGDITGIKEKIVIRKDALEDIEGYKQILSKIEKVKQLEREPYNNFAKRIDYYYYSELLKKYEELMRKFLELRVIVTEISKIDNNNYDISSYLYTEGEGYENKYRMPGNINLNNELLRNIEREDNRSIYSLINNQIDLLKGALE